MEWPSKNIPRGGIFNNAKPTYSKETQNFMKTLLDEQKMSIFHRNKINYCLRNGEPLPKVENVEAANRHQNIFGVIHRPSTSKRRSLETIRQSGAYEREQYRPLVPPVDREKVKEELIRKMANEGTEKPKAAPKCHKPKAKVPEMNRYEELKGEIHEREVWLRKMEELGEGPKYRDMIRMQILERLREIESLKVQA